MLRLRFVSEKPYHWWRPFRKPIELYRCECCMIVLTDRMIQQGICAGHRVKQPTVPTWTELILIWLGVIR